MKPDRKAENRAAWKQQYQELLRGFIAELGGEKNISPATRQTAKTYTALQIQLSMLSARFASESAPPKELMSFLKLSEKAEELRRALGLGQKAQQPQTAKDDAADKKLWCIIMGKIEVRKELVAQCDEEEAQGIFRYPGKMTFDDWNYMLGPITDPDRIVYEKQIYLLKQQIKVLELQRDGVVPEPNLLPAPVAAREPEPEPEPAPAKPEPPPINVTPIRREPKPKTSTQLFYEWSAAGGTFDTTPP